MKTFHFKGRFGKADVHVNKYQYSNGRTALELSDTADNFPFMRLTVNMPEVYLKDDEVIIKDYSENEGALDFVLKNKICVLRNKYNNSHVTVHICQLLPESEWTVAPAEIESSDFKDGKHLFIIDGYRIWATSAEEAQEHYLQIKDL